MAGFRTEQVGGVIRNELSTLIRQAVDETRNALVTITKVSLSPDFQLARIYISVFPESADSQGIIDALTNNRGRLKRDLGRAIHLRRIPDLEFKLDTTAEESARIDELLKKEGLGNDEEPDSDEDGD
jgi:ribosome-binding factor A